jgi:hypothetical protein
VVRRRRHLELRIARRALVGRSLRAQVDTLVVVLI